MTHKYVGTEDKMMFKSVLLLFFVPATLAQSEEWRTVNLEQGPVRGRIDPEGDVYTFYNIPYASAPTGRDRFKAPLAAPVWTQAFDAIDRGIVCPQPQSVPDLNVQEDCLVANVFIPDTEEINLPVVVHIHGGAYQQGLGTSESFNALVRTKKIIVVSFNYRLGVHGFLCLGTEGAPGNAGMKDQIALLRWVNKNIASFGGNPEQVTIYGCSAGGGSVDILTLSEAARGLFQRAIIDSGAIRGGVGLQTDPIGNAKEYAALLNFDNVDDLESLEEFYKTASYEILSSRIDAILYNEDNSIMFAPCLENNLGQERLLNDTPVNLIKSGNYNKIPLMYGFTNYEGLMMIHLFETWSNQMNEKFSDFLPNDLQFDSEEEKEEVAMRVKEFYFGEQPVSKDNVESYINFFTDVMFGYPVLRSVRDRMESLEDTIYLFEYSFVDENTATVLDTDLVGAHHCAQLVAVMDQDKTIATEEYVKMKAIMREYWLNFMLTGAPSDEGSTLPVWDATTANRSPHMSLGRVVELQGMLLQDRAALWDTIYDQYYKAPKLPIFEDNSAGTRLVSKLFVFTVVCSLFGIL